MASISQTTAAASLTIAELREFASFSQSEQRYIERALDIGLARAGNVNFGDLAPHEAATTRAQTTAYRALRGLRAWVANNQADEGLDGFLGSLICLSAQDLARGQLISFSAYRFLYERLLGPKVRPWLPSAFCAAAALPSIAPHRRKQLLHSLSGAAVTAEEWCSREPVFYPEKLAAEAA